MVFISNNFAIARAVDLADRYIYILDRLSQVSSQRQDSGSSSISFTTFHTATALSVAAIFDMTLTFKPALQTTTALPVAPNGRATLQFSASFSTRDEYVRTRRDGAHIEMWTNLPVGGHDGSDWHALAFGYPDEETTISPDAASNKVFTLSPTTTENVYLGDNSTVVLDLALTDARPGAVYSFTYRLVHANGAIQWLGAYGQNGDLVLEEQETRFTLAPGSTLEDGTIVNSDLNAEDASVTLATLNKSIDWVCWGFNEDGYVSSITPVIRII